MEQGWELAEALEEEHVGNQKSYEGRKRNGCL
jgi:hypothetical protein